MKILSKVCLVLFVFCLGLVALLQSAYVVAASSRIVDQFVVSAQEKSKIFPPGKWGVAFVPVAGGPRAESSSLPVLVNAVWSSARSGNGPVVTSARVVNMSNKTVKSIALLWTIRSDDEPNRVLAEGSTSIIDLSKGLETGEVTRITYPIMSFFEVHKQLVKNGELNGSFEVEISVSAVNFDDGSSWVSKVEETVEVNV